MAIKGLAQPKLYDNKFNSQSYDNIPCFLCEKLVGIDDRIDCDCPRSTFCTDCYKRAMTENLDLRKKRKSFYYTKKKYYITSNMLRTAIITK